jgi:hypothetical protein
VCVVVGVTFAGRLGSIKPEYYNNKQGAYRKEKRLYLRNEIKNSFNEGLDI